MKEIRQANYDFIESAYERADIAWKEYVKLSKTVQEASLLDNEFGKY